MPGRCWVASQAGQTQWEGRSSGLCADRDPFCWKRGFLIVPLSSLVFFGNDTAVLVLARCSQGVLSRSDCTNRAWASGWQDRRLFEEANPSLPAPRTHPICG